MPRSRRPRGATLVHPYADAAVIAGQGTATVELLREAGPVDAMVVPVGGGGLSAGTALALSGLAPGCALVLAEPAGAADAARSLGSGVRDVDFVPDTSSATACAPASVFRISKLLRKAGAEVITVDDGQVVAAMQLVWQVLEQVIEPSSATVLAAVLAQPARFAGKRVGLVLVSGGNVDLGALPWR